MQHSFDTHASRPRPRRTYGARTAAAAWSLLFAVVLFGGVFGSDMPGATEPKNPPPPVVQQVVEQQLHALAAQDAGRAFALAAPDMRTQFGSAEAFLATVRSEYPMLMHPVRVLYLKPESDGTIAMQKVRLTDNEGASWSLTYLLNRQQDNQWRISACVVTPEGRQILT